MTSIDIMDRIFSDFFIYYYFFKLESRYNHYSMHIHRPSYLKICLRGHFVASFWSCCIIFL